jgi:hypothetical protein
MTVRRVLTLLFKILMVVAVAYCITTTIRMWLGGPIQKPHDTGYGWIWLWCSFALTILRRLGVPIGRGWDVLHEIVLLAAHFTTGVGMTRPGAPSQPPHQEDAQ